MIIEDKFPYIFGRKGGAKLEILDVLKAPKSLKNILALYTEEQEIDILKQISINDLECIIGRENDFRIKTVLISFKRDFYNSRSLEKYRSFFSNYPSLYEKIDLYSNKIQVYHEHLEQYRVSFDIEFYKGIYNLKSISELFFYKNGLLFASSTLGNETQKCEFRFNTLNKKRKRLVLSTMRYLTRSVAKTTPFSSFNSIYCLEYSKNRYVALTTPIEKSNFHITNLFFYFLKVELLRNKQFKSILKVNCNNTLLKSIDGGDLINFFVNINNNESFKRLNSSPILLYIQDQLLDRVISYSDLIEKLKEITNETYDSVELYVDKLIEEGFLHLSYPVSCDDQDWIQELLNFISQNKMSDFVMFSELFILLNNILGVINELQKAIDVNKRKQIISESYNRIIAFFDSTDCDFINKVRDQDLYYEDTYTDSDKSVPMCEFDAISNDLKSAYHNLNIISYKRNYKKELAKYLDENKELRLSLLAFYEQIFLKFGKEFSLKYTEIADCEKILTKFMNHVDLFKINFLDKVDISEFTERREKLAEVIPFGAYVQPNKASWESAVLNSFSDGNGTNISRFLNCLPISQSNKVLAYNKKVNKSKILMDVKDASIHNVNIFPPLSEHVLSVCENAALNKRYKSILLSEVYVSYSSKSGLILENIDGMEIQPNKFSLEGINRKSKLVQFIDLFNPVDISGYQFIIQNIRRLFEEKVIDNSVIQIPRIFYGDRLIIQRKKWLMNKTCVLSLFDNNRNSLDEIYLIINRWIKHNNIPDEIFFKRNTSQVFCKNNDHHKPQYINFTIPTLVMLFINEIDKSDDIIEITEMYPTSSVIAKNSGYVEEYVLNIN